MPPTPNKAFQLFNLYSFLALFALDTPKFEAFQEGLISDYPFFQELFDRHKNAFGWHPSFSSKAKLVFILMGIAGIAAPCLLLTFLFLYFRQLNYVKNHLNVVNRSLHTMLFRALTAQVVTLFMVVVIPLIVFTSQFIFPFKHGCFGASIAFLITPVYTFLDIMGQFYFIKPYKKWINQKLRRKVIVKIINIENFQ